MNKQCEKCNSSNVVKGKLFHTIAGLAFISEEESGETWGLRKKLKKSLITAYACNNCGNVFGFELLNFIKDNRT